MKKISFAVNYIPLKTYASVQVEAASQPVQEYDAITGEYYPDRGLVPLVISPMVGYDDPNNGTSSGNAAAMLTDGHWYRLDNTTSGNLDASTEITSGTTYIIDTAAGSATYGKLTVKENVLPGNPVTYVFRAVLVYTNGEKVPIETRWQARTKATETVPKLSLDNATETMYNPWGTEDEFVLNPVLKPLPTGATVSYKWETLHGSAWHALGSTHLDWAVSASGNGVKIKRSKMQDRIDLKCTSTITVNGKTFTDFVTAVIVRRLPDFDCDIINVMNINADVKTIAPKALIRVGKTVIENTKGELEIIWYNSAGSEIARGINPTISISQLGGKLEIGMDYKDAGGWKALTEAGGAFITEPGTGALIIVK